MLTRPALPLRLEEACLLAAAVILYAHLHFRWWLFAGLFFAPDLFMLGYLLSARTGAAIYNLGHVLFLPLAVLAVSWTMDRPLLVAIALIWIGHIALDRMLGYGLKYPAHFKDTHLQHIP